MRSMRAPLPILCLVVTVLGGVQQTSATGGAAPQASDAASCLRQATPALSCVETLFAAAEKQMGEGDASPGARAARLDLGDLYARKALAFSQGLFGENDGRTARAYNYVAIFAGEYNRAEEEAMTRRAIAIGRKFSDPLQFGVFLRNLARIVDDPKEAEALCREALAIAEKHDHREAMSYSIERLGVALMQQGRNADADPYLHRSLALSIELYGSKSAEAAQAYYNLGVNLYRQGRREEARMFYRQALALRRQVFGEMHLRTAAVYSELAGIALAMGEFDESATMYGKAYAIRRKLLGDGHKDSISTAFQAGQVLWEEGDQKGGVAIMRRALDAMQAAPNVDALDVASQKRLLAMFVHQEGDHVEDERLRREGIAVYLKRLPSTDPLLIGAMSEFADVLAMHGQIAESLTYHRLSTDWLLTRLKDSSRDPNLANERARKHGYFRRFITVVWAAGS